MPYRLAALALVVVAAACSSTSTTSTTSTTVSPATTAATPATTQAPTSGTTTAGVDPDIAAALQAEVIELAGIAEELRGLEFFDEPAVVVLTEDELAARVRQEVLADLEPGEVEWTEDLLSLLGLFDPAEQSLLDLYLDLVGEQVVGLYMPETGELLVRGDAAELSVLSRTTVIHELLHALTDQHFDIGTTLDDLIAADEFDEAAAYLSFLEGEATYFQLRYITEYLSAAETLALASEMAAVESPALEATPYAISEPLFFRYETGFDFVLDLAEEGGITALNETHVAPPTTTEHIAHPRRFFDSEAPIDVSLPPATLPAYEVVEESSWGELTFLATFGQALGVGAAAQIGDGWGGDAYRVSTSGGEVVLQLAYEGDSSRDASEVAEAFRQLAASMDAGEGVAEGSAFTFSGEDFAYVDIVDRRVVFVAATDPEAGAAVAATMTP